MVRVREVETFLGLFKTDTMSAAVVCRLGIVRIRDRTDKLRRRLLILYLDMYKTRLTLADAMFEGVLHKWHEQQWGDLKVCVVHIIGELHVNLLRQTDLHQTDITLDKLHLVLHRHLVKLIVVKHVAQQFRELFDGILGSLLVEGRKGIDIVQGVKQEMGIDLRTQVLQLNLRAGCLYLKTGFLVMLDTSGKDNGRR